MADKQILRDQFDCVVHELYAAAAAVALATACRSGSLHANTDWFIVELMGLAGIQFAGMALGFIGTDVPISPTN